MEWTDAKPTQDGWYWYKDKNGWWSRPVVIYRVVFGSRYGRAYLRGTSMRLDWLDGRWAGPIPEPDGPDGGPTDT